MLISTAFLLSLFLYFGKLFQVNVWLILKIAALMLLLILLLLIGYKKIIAKDNLTSYACKNNGTVLAQDWCRPNMLGLLDQAFTDKLQYAEPKKKKMNDEW